MSAARSSASRRRQAGSILKKVNLAKVRSAIGLTIALVACSLAPAAASARRRDCGAAPAEPAGDARRAAAATAPRVSRAGGGRASPRACSAPGSATVPPEQTYLDITQGNRVFDSLYDPSCRRCGAGLRAGWCEARRRAPNRRRPTSSRACSPRRCSKRWRRGRVAAERRALRRLGGSADGTGRVGGAPRRSPTSPFEPVAEACARWPELRGDDLLIAIERPPPAENAAAGDRDRRARLRRQPDLRQHPHSTATCSRPTSRRRSSSRFGLAGPLARCRGSRSAPRARSTPAAVESLGDADGGDLRPARPGDRPQPARLARRRSALVAAARPRARWRGWRCGWSASASSTCRWCSCSAPRSSRAQAAERLLVVLGAPLLAALTLAACRGYRALAVACGADRRSPTRSTSIAGSPLTSLSLLGPNPGLGVRFYGIGNELEALLAVLVVAGTGAALAGFAPRRSPRRARPSPSSPSACSPRFVFAAGRFGADVGAAIVFPVGAAVAAAVVGGRAASRPALLVARGPARGARPAGADRPRLRRRRPPDPLGARRRRPRRSRRRRPAPAAALGAQLRAADRLRLPAAGRRRRRARLSRGATASRAWLGDARRCARGSPAPSRRPLVGTLANDSGALLLEIGTAYLLVFAGFAWAEN